MRLTPGLHRRGRHLLRQLDTRPVGRHRVYVCTNISCSLRGGDELLDAIEHETAEDPDVYVRHFECLGACDIAPMASVDGVYVGPIELEEVPSPRGADPQRRGSAARQADPAAGEHRSDGEQP